MAALLGAAANQLRAEAATVASSKRFDLTAGSHEWLREIPLNETRIMQSFAFDNTNRHLYTAQLIQGGRILTGETRACTAAERATNGDLCITRLDWNGLILGRMYLKGFGHGVSIGVEPSGSGACLWTETDSVPDSLNEGHGTKVARFMFANGAVIQPDSYPVTRFDPVPGSDHNTVAVDPVTDRLVHRYRIDDAWNFGLYDLTSFKAGTFTPLATLAQPPVLSGVTFQGYTSMGQYLYTLDGTSYAYDADGNQTSTSNTYLTSVDWNTGIVQERRLSNAGQSLFYREPEGLAIQIPDSADPTAARLFLGFGSEVSLSDTGKKASFYDKDLLV